MDVLNSILGGGGNAQQLQDFANRWQSNGGQQMSGQEVADQYSQVAPNLTPDQYQAAARDAFSKMTPEQRSQFGQWLQTQTQQQGMHLPQLDENTTSAEQMQDPNVLAQATTRVHQEQPNILEQLMGKGGTGGALDNPIAKAAFAGIVAMAAQHIMGGRR